MDNSNQASFDKLKMMVSHCQELENLLKIDRDYFGSRDLKKISESNQRKIFLLKEVAHICDEIKASQQDNVLEKISQEASSWTMKSQHEARHLSNELKAIIAKCNQHILTNSHIVFDNIKQLKNIWEKIVSFKSEPNCTYDKNGYKIR